MMVFMIGGEAGFRAVPAIIANRIYQAGENISSSAKAGDTKAIEKHLTEGADVNGRDPLDGTPLHWAAVQGHTNALKLLIEKGADVNQINLFGYTPLMTVVKNNEPQLAKCLLDNGAGKTINQINNDKQTCWSLSEEKGFKDKTQIKSIIQDFHLKENFKTINKNRKRIL